MNKYNFKFARKAFRVLLVFLAHYVTNIGQVDGFVVHVDLPVDKIHVNLPVDKIHVNSSTKKIRGTAMLAIVRIIRIRHIIEGIRIGKQDTGIQLTHMITYDISRLR